MEMGFRDKDHHLSDCPYHRNVFFNGSLRAYEGPVSLLESWQVNIPEMTFLKIIFAIDANYAIKILSSRRNEE